MSEVTDTEGRTAPGSAQQSQAPATCLTGALLIFIALFQLVSNDLLEEYFVATTGLIVAGIWAVCLIGMLAVAAWAKKDKDNPKSSLADLLPQRVVGAAIFFIAAIASLLLGL